MIDKEKLNMMNNKPSDKPVKSKSIGKQDIVNLLWIMCYIGLIVAAFVLVSGTFALLVFGVVSLFGILK